MAKFAPVAPIQILEEMARRKVLGDYHLLLAHHVLEEPERFKALFLNRPQSTIIMDNSIVELGDAASDAKVHEACQIVSQYAHGGGFISHWVIPVLTDVMGDGAATRVAATISYEWWEKNTPDPVMVVLQGESWLDFCKTVDYFLASDKFSRIEYVGIPRVFTDTIASREAAVQYVTAIAPRVNIHLLGFSNDVMDDIMCANMPDVEGIDSAVPLRYAYSASDTEGYYTPTADIPPRPAEWFSEGTFTDADYTNLVNIRKWVA